MGEQGQLWKKNQWKIWNPFMELALKEVKQFVTSLMWLKLYWVELQNEILCEFKVF